MIGALNILSRGLQGSKYDGTEADLGKGVSSFVATSRLDNQGWA